MKRLLLACVPTAVRRSRACVLLLALTAGISTVSVLAQTPPALPTPNGGTPYLFVPGHGVTGRTTGNPEKTLQQVIDEAVAINGDSAYKVKIRFVEHAYSWKDFQPNNETSADIRIDGLDGLGGLKADLIKCREKGLRLRVLLTTHKYDQNFPNWVIASANHPDPLRRHVRKVQSGFTETGEPNMVWMVNLNNRSPNLNNDTYDLLVRLYQGVIGRLKDLDHELENTFYGFVLQESNTGYLGEFEGNQTIYTDTDIDPGTDTEHDRWFNSLYELHKVLGTSLQGFTTENGNKPKRLFWQMINYPRNKTQSIVSSVDMNHGGLCGPDTFPREPHWRHPGPGAQLELGLTRAYAQIRAASRGNLMPTSLHVYDFNYSKPYHPGSMPMEDQPIYETADNDNDDDGLSTPSGIVNFLGCVPDDPNVPGDLHPNRLWVHNIVWALADGPGSPGGSPSPWCGWPRVKFWMTNTTRTVPDAPGGCNPTTPESL